MKRIIAILAVLSFFGCARTEKRLDPEELLFQTSLGYHLHSFYIHHPERDPSDHEWHVYWCDYYSNVHDYIVEKEGLSHD